MRHKLQRAVALYRHRGLPAVGNALCKLYDRRLRPARAHSVPHYLIVETTTRCNLSCRFCPRTAEGVTGGQDMAVADFVRILDQFPLLEGVVVQGIGEPLLHPGLFDMIRVARERGIQTEFNTNGTLLQEQRCTAIIASGVELVSVSVDAVEPAQFAELRRGATLDQVAAGLRRLVAARQAAGVTHPQLMLRTVVSRRNYDALPAIIAWGRAQGINTFVLQDLLVCSPEDDDQVIDAQAYAALIREVSRWQRTKGDILLVGFNRYLPSIGRSRCGDPWDQPFIAVDGSVVPCCTIGDPRRISFGNVFQRPFAEIWNDAAYQAFRRGFDRMRPVVCRGCSKY
ncbi:MAG TPA: radical SAM protein [bacterium]|nr:radical SAM protein [bacterium]